MQCVNMLPIVYCWNKSSRILLRDYWVCNAIKDGTHEQLTTFFFCNQTYICCVLFQPQPQPCKQTEPLSTKFQFYFWFPRSPLHLKHIFFSKQRNFWTNISTGTSENWSLVDVRWIDKSPVNASQVEDQNREIQVHPD
jgi:hypothetical protein